MTARAPERERATLGVGLDVEASALLNRLAVDARQYLAELRGALRRDVLRTTPQAAQDLCFTQRDKAAAAAARLGSIVVPWAQPAGYEVVRRSCPAEPGIAFTEQTDAAEFAEAVPDTVVVRRKARRGYTVVDPRWLASYTRSSQMHFGLLEDGANEWLALLSRLQDRPGERPPFPRLSDEDALRLVQEERKLLGHASFKALVCARLDHAAAEEEPSAIEELSAFFAGLSAAVTWRPPGRGQHRELDAERVTALYRQRLARNRRVKKTYRQTGEVPASHLLPVLEDPKRGRHVTIEERTWPEFAAWTWLAHALGEPRAKLQTLSKPSRRRT